MGHLRPIMGPRGPKTLNLLLKLTIYQSQKILWPRDSLEDARRRRSYEDLKRREFFQPSSGWFI